MIAVMLLHTEHIFKLQHLFNHLLQPLIFIHQQPDTAPAAVAEGQTEYAVHIISSASEEPADMRHNSGMIIYYQLQDGMPLSAQ
jgi:hypothetical protein